MQNLDLLSYELGSGQFANQHLATLIISGQYRYWRAYWQKLNSQPHQQKNRLHQALDYIFSATASLKAEALCPHCQQRSVKLIALRDCGGYFDSLQPKHCCCQNKICRQTACYIAGNRATVRLLGFSLYEVKSHYGNRREINDKEVLKILQWAFKLPPAEKDQVVNFFLQKKNKRLRKVS